MESQAALVNGALRGETASLGALFDLHAETVYGIALGYVSCSADARDLVQDIFVKAFGSLSSLRDPSSFNAWLFRIARTTSLDYQEKRKRTVLTDPSVIEEIAAEAGNNRMERGETPANSLEESHACVADVLHALPDEHRVVLTLRYLNEMSYDQIADTLEIERSEVSNRLTRAKRYVKKHLAHLESH